MLKISSTKTEEINSICFIINKNWCKFLTVAITSLLDHINQSYIYEILILHNNELDNFHCQEFNKFSSKNVFIKILDISSTVKKYNINNFFTHGYWGTEMYYRVFLPEILPNHKKVLYVDADILFCDDFSKLFKTNMGIKEIGVCPTLRQYYYSITNPNERKYYKSVLNINNMQHYFNSGVLLMNLEIMRKNNFINRFIHTMNSILYLEAPDQDVFNVLYKESNLLILLDTRWNHIHYSNEFLEKMKKVLPSSIMSKYYESCINPGIIHFAGQMKPWLNPEYDFGVLFWSYAKRTCYYESLLLTSAKQFADLAVKLLNIKYYKRKLRWYKFLSFFAYGKRKQKLQIKYILLSYELFDLKSNFKILKYISSLKKRKFSDFN